MIRRKLPKDRFVLLFADQDCIIAKNGEVESIAKLSPELYEVKTVTRVCTASEAVNSPQGDNYQYMWSMCFGHRNLDAIKDLVQKGLATN